jgi:tetratricopeptide (TPR) repeat protein/predicted Ser/Thr protein kinase
MLGKSFSHYRVLETLGQGGMGVVYLAEDTLLGRRVAIKFPHADGPSQRLLTEARTASSLNHPAIAAVYDCGIFEDHPYVVMEFVEGENLAAILARGPLPHKRALEIAAQAAAALSEAHSHSIVHRDIKPSNIQIDRHGAVKVLDFGIATSVGEVRVAAAGDDLLAATRTLDGAVTGTPRYMSPEQARGGRADARTDVFALGLVFWECLTGQPAFAGHTAIDTLAQVIQTDPAPPSQVNPGVPPVLDRICATALAKDPATRYQSAAALLADLESARHTLAEPAPPPALARRPWRRYLIAASAACLLAAVAAAAVFWLRRGREPDPQALRWYQEGANAIRDATYFKAANALDRAVSIDPSFALAHARLADASDELDDATRAREEMLKAVAPDSPRSRLSRLDDLAVEAIRRTLTNDAAGAAAVYGDLLARSPESDKAAVLLDLGRAYEKAGQPQKARASFLEAARRSPQYAAAFLRLGVLDRRAQRVADAEKDLAQAESLYRALSNAEGLTEVLYQRAVMANKRGEIQQAASLLDQALQLARTTGNYQQQIAALLQLSNVETHQGDASAAARHATEATDLAHARGLDPLAAAGLLDIGNAHFVHGDLSEAEDCFMRCLDLARHSHASRAEARALLSLGSIHIQQAKLTEGVQNVEQALHFYQQGGDAQERSVALVLLGRARRDQGDYSGALRAFREQLDLAAASGDPAQLQNAREGLASVLEAQERYPEALASYQEAAAAGQARGDKLAAGYALASSALVLARLGRYSEAREALAEASAIARGPGGYDDLARLVDRYQSEIALSQRQISAARDGAHKLMASPDKLGSSGMVEAGDVYCSAQILSGARQAGLTACLAALEEARKSGVPGMVSGAQLAVAEAQLENGDSARARETALSARGRFSLGGQPESEARASLIAARAARASGDTAAARELAAAAAHSFAALYRTWTPEARAAYDARPDVRSWRSQIARLMADPPPNRAAARVPASTTASTPNRDRQEAATQ